MTRGGFELNLQGVAKQQKVISRYANKTVDPAVYTCQPVAFFTFCGTTNKDMIGMIPE